MDVAIVTGAATGIGLAISRRLVAMGCRVYGLGGNFRETSYSHEYFIPTPCDLRDIEDIEEKINHVLNREGDVYVLVNNAKSFGTTSFLDKFNLRELETTLQINLLCPLVLIRLLLPGLKQLQGFVVNIAPTSAETAKGAQRVLPQQEACAGWESPSLMSAAIPALKYPPFFLKQTRQILPVTSIRRIAPRRQLLTPKPSLRPSKESSDTLKAIS